MLEIACVFTPGYCQCGCGQKTSLGKVNRPGREARGEPQRYVKGHNKRLPVSWTVEDRGYATACHITRHPVSGFGYGHITRDGKTYKAHRWAWERAHGQIPDDLQVLHHCDVPACVNVEHLFLGTQRDNMVDMASKGRKPVGERTPMAKLSEADVREIRAAYAKGRPLAALARQFGVCPATIRFAVTRGTWKHVEDAAA